MIKSIYRCYKAEGIKGVAIHTHDYLMNLLTPVFMRIIELLVPPKNKVVFSNFAGRGYGGYPRALCDELIRRNDATELVWLVKGKKRGEFPSQVRTVNANSYKALKELATAKVWIDNCRKGRKIRKGKKQFYFQMWHAGGPALKYIEGDAKEYLPKEYIEDAMNDTKMADLFVSDCEWQNNNYRTAFWYQGEIMNCTTPPNDIFYDNWAETKERVYAYFGLPLNIKLILYAPTFRNCRTTEFLDLDFRRIEAGCRDRFGGDWRLLVRFHPTMSEECEAVAGKYNVINATRFPQIEDLMIASEVFITDFSASMFLAFRWKVKSFLYASDYEDYVSHERPLYFDINQLPAYFSKTNDELLNAITSFSEEEYEGKCETFSRSVGFFEGGRSVELLTNRIEQELDKVK